ncbi:sperm-associated antigen 5 [Pleurodeles waltl]
MRAMRRDTPDENEPAVKQSVLRKSGVRTPLRDLMLQPNATSEPKLPNQACFLSSKRMLTPLLNKMPTKMAHVSEMGTPDSIWADTQPQQMLGTQGKLGSHLPFTSTITETGTENMCLPLQTLSNALLPFVVVEPSINEVASEGEPFVSDDVESIGLYSYFTRNTPKDHKRIVTQKGEFASNLTQHKSLVLPLEVPETSESHLQPKDLGKCILTGLCPDESAVVESMERQETVMTYSHLDTAAAVSLPRGEKELSIFDLENQCPNANSSTAIESAATPSVESKYKQVFQCDVSADSPLKNEHGSLDPERRRITAAETEPRQSAAILNHQVLEANEKGRVFLCEKGSKGPLPVPFKVEPILHHCYEPGSGEGLPHTPPRNSVCLCPDLPLLSSTNKLHQSSGSVGIIGTGPPGAMTGRNQDQLLGAILSVTNQEPIFQGENRDALTVGRLTCQEEVLSAYIVGCAQSLNNIQDESALEPSGRGDPECSPLNAIISERTPALKIINDNDSLPFCSGMDRRSLKFSSSMVNGGILPLHANGDLLLNSGQEEKDVPLLTGASKDDILGVEFDSSQTVMEPSGCSEQKLVQVSTVCENHRSSVRKMSCSHGRFIENAAMVPSKKQTLGPESHCPQNTLPPEVETVLQLTEWDMNASLERFISENGLEHSILSQATPYETSVSPTKSWNVASSGIKSKAETVARSIGGLCTAEGTGMLMAEENGLHSGLLPSGIGEKPSNLEPPSTPLSSQLESSRHLLSPCAVTGDSTFNLPEKSVNPDSKLTGMRQSISLSVSEQEANTSRTPVSTSALFTWLTPLDLLEKSMNISASEIFGQLEWSPVPQQEVGTNVTPISRSSAATWMTPIMIVDQSMNTSASFASLAGRRKPCTQDSGVVTDSLLWNFSRERLSTVPRQELENRLENTLTVIEVLSRQLQDWQQNRVLSSCLGPSEQREACIQTDVIHISEEQQHYYNLYVRAMGRLQCLQQSQSEEVQLSTDLRKASSILQSQRDEFDSVLACAEHFYMRGQKDLEALSQQVCQMRALFTDHMTVLKKMESKHRENLELRDEMKSRMEKALRAQEAADACLTDLEIHSSSVINQLRRDLECEKELCVTLQEVGKQQLHSQKDVIKCIESSHAFCQNMKADRDLMQAQCKESQELLNRHLNIMNRMTERIQTVLEEQTALRCDMDQAILEKQKMCNKLAESTSELHDVLIKNEQLNLERARLGAELASLMERVSELESERDGLEEMVSEKSLQLSAREESLLLLEQALEEKSARVKDLESQTWQMNDALLGHEQALSQTRKEKDALQTRVQHLEEQQAFLQGEMSKYNKRLQQMAELKAQLSAFSESIEFIEQENTVAREENAAYRLQLSEMESQLKANLATLRERSYQWELKKDEVVQLQKERDFLQEELETTKADARTMLLKMGNEITDSSFEVIEAKDKLLGLMETLKMALEGEDVGAAVLWDTHTPASNTNGAVTGFSVRSVLKSKQHIEDQPKESNSSILGNETSAFTKVQPATPKPAEQSLSSSLSELMGIIADLAYTSSRLCCVKRDAICQLKNELADQRSELQSLTLRHTSEVENLKEEIESLKMQNQHQGEALSIRQQNVKQLQAMVQQQEVTVLQLLSERKEVENLYSEISQLKRSLQLAETEAEVLRKELSSSSEASSRAWIQEKILLQQDLTKLRLLLIDTENSKSEVLQKTMRHREVLEHNLQCSEQEVKKLDNIIEKIRETLLSIPDIVTSCEVLKELVEYLG